MRRLLLAAALALLPTLACAQTQPQFEPFLNNPPQGLSPGSSPTFSSLTISSMTQGSVLFAGAGGLVSQDNSNFFWDGTNHFLGILTSSPQVAIHARGAGGAASIVRSQTTNSASYAGLQIWNDINTGVRSFELNYSGSTYASALLSSGPTGESASLATTGAFPLVFGTSNIARVTIAAGGNVGIRTILPQAMLHVGSTAATAQTFNTFTDASNYENAYMGDWGVSANVATYGTGKAGTGVARAVNISAGGVTGLSLDTSANVVVASGKTFQVGSTYAAGVVVPAGSITIKDATGTVYKISACTGC